MPEVADIHSAIRYLRRPELLAILSVSWATMRGGKKGLFPKRRKLGPHIVGWREDEVREWCPSHLCEG